ncbi:cytochrome c biogenesis protein [Sulfurivirga caldicuralii]|uniref:Cytochrome c biogenesis protein n=1 Tax=Sulfurivirga caldicuralii TaxID=364032 RepID=A0A1N6HB17_9GAMM|nr:cytochrome c biogenesis protein ResB [Sulfurivirga caldicuralii]SIO16887.1 cytochrome c biogenesis protein [Sulfurivirga caldicuralii]
MAKPVSRARAVYDFFSSMSLAVTLLVMLAIASVIGTVVKQGEPYQNYVVKFGPFWAELFEKIGIFHIYSTWWFVLVILFLIVSTTTCVIRHVPVFLRDMNSHAENLSRTALLHQPNHAEVACTQSDVALQTMEAALKQEGFKLKRKESERGVMIAGMKGRWNRLGYFLTHIGIVVILLGAVVDSNLMLKYKVMTGQAVPETRDVPISQINPKAVLPQDNISFRGSVTIPEGQKADFIFLPYDRGYFLQQLPFEMIVKKFHINYYDTGMPKDFITDLVVRDKATGKTVEHTLRVNHPLILGDIAIYQSSFEDGGTQLQLKLYPLTGAETQPMEMTSRIGQKEILETTQGKLRFEFDDFKLHNVVPTTPEEEKQTGRKMHNNGPKLVYKIRNEQGTAKEYETYMLPLKQQGREFFVAGVRDSVAEPYRYLFIPADEKRSLKRFMAFIELLNNDQKRLAIFAQYIKSDPQFSKLSVREQALQIQLWQNLIRLFRDAGFKGIEHFIKTNVPEDKQKSIKDFYLAQLTDGLQVLYVEMLKQQGRIKSRDELTDFDKTWFEDAINAVLALPKFGYPIFVKLESFKLLMATGLQVTKSPGKDIVYFGSLMLTLGVFLLFYVRQRRVWVYFDKSTTSDNGHTVVIAAKDNKNTPEMEKEFKRLLARLQQTCGGTP